MEGRVHLALEPLHRRGADLKLLAIAQTNLDTTSFTSVGN